MKNLILPILMLCGTALGMQQWFVFERTKQFLVLDALGVLEFNSNDLKSIKLSHNDLEIEQVASMFYVPSITDFNAATLHSGEHEVKTDSLVISYLDTFMYFLDENVKWTIAFASGEQIFRGSGPISNFVFKNPGHYTIQIIEEHEYNENICNHAKYPDFIDVLVSPFRLKFDFSTLEFSTILQSGSFDGIEIAVTCNYSHFLNETYQARDLRIIGSGIGAEFIGLPSYSEVLLRPGENRLSFKLQGTVQRGTYIMFDFMDVNNQIQTYYHPAQIK